MDVQCDAGSELARAGQKPDYQGQAANKKEPSRHEIEPVWRIHEHKTQTSPAIAETTQMRWAAPFVRPENDRNLTDTSSNLAGLDNEFKSELHARTAQIQGAVKGVAETPHSAIAVAHPRAEEEIHQPTQTGIAEILVQRGHR